MQRHIAFVAVLLGISHAAMILTSRDFKNFGMIPGDYGCDVVTGEDRDPFKPSPPLKWYRAPAKTRSFVLLVDDIDNGGFVHWLVTNIPANVTQLDMDASGVAMPDGAKEYANSYGGIGWGGPCPLGETHRYRFRLFALNIPSIELTMPSNATCLRAPAIQRQLDEYTLYVAVLAGDYMCPIHPHPKPITVPTRTRSYPPIEIIRYFKPSESFRKKGKNAGIQDSETLKCRKGSESAQTNKFFEAQPPPERFVSPAYPTPQQWVGNLPTLSTDEASTLSPAEAAARGVRPGGLQPINTNSPFSLDVPTATPRVQTPFNLGEWAGPDPALGTVTQLEVDSGAQDAPEQALVQGDLLVMDDATRRSETTLAVSQLTSKLENQAAECLDCNKGFIRPSRRRYSLSVRPVGFVAALPAAYTCNVTRPLELRPSPPLAWRLAPPAAHSLVLLMDDVTNENDTDTYGFVQWLVVNIPPSVLEIADGASRTSAMPAGATEMPNSNGLKGYLAPCPHDNQPHHYRVRVYALPSATVELPLTQAYRAKDVEKLLHPLVTAAMELSFTSTAVFDGSVIPTPTQSVADAQASLGVGNSNQVFVPPDAIGPTPPSGPSFFAGGDPAMNALMNH